MNMWNWLLRLYNGEYLTIEDLEKVMEDDDMAEELWEDFVMEVDFIEYVQDEVKSFLKYIKEKKNKEQ